MFYRIQHFSLQCLHLAKYLLCISVVLIYYVIFIDGALVDEQTPAVTGISSADCIPSERRTLADGTTHVDTAVSTTGCATCEQKTLVDDLTRSNTAVSVADCTMCEQNILSGEMTHADTAVSTTGCATSEQKTLVDDLTRPDTTVSVADCTMSVQNILSGEMTHADTGVSVANCITEILGDNPPPATNDVLLTACGLITLVGDMSRVVSSSNRSAKQTANIINGAQCMYSSSNSEVVSAYDSDYIPCSTHTCKVDIVQ